MRFRDLIQTRASWALLLLAVALAARLLVPSGYMISVSEGSVAIVLCSGTGPMTMTTMTMPGMAHHGDGKDHGVADPPCPFTALAAPALGGTDPVLLVAAIAFVFALAFQPDTPAPPRRVAFLRPPLRGPPAIV